MKLKMNVTMVTNLEEFSIGDVAIPVDVIDLESNWKLEFVAKGSRREN